MASSSSSGSGLESQAGQGEIEGGAELVGVVVDVELVDDLVDEREVLGIELSPGLGPPVEICLAIDRAISYLRSRAWNPVVKPIKYPLFVY